jgi:hypothetical protein
MPNSASSKPAQHRAEDARAVVGGVSIDSADPMRSAPTESPIIIRRTGLSATQAEPLRKLAAARCQTAIASKARQDRQRERDRRRYRDDQREDAPAVEALGRPGALPKAPTEWPSGRRRQHREHGDDDKPSSAGSACTA